MMMYEGVGTEQISSCRASVQGRRPKDERPSGYFSLRARLHTGAGLSVIAPV